MPERQRGRDPDRLQQKEQARNSYHRAARYPHEDASEAPYDTLRQLIFDEPCNLSAYRLRVGEALEWHVAVLGEHPLDELQRRIEDVLATGEPVTLPQEILNVLIQRRRTHSGKGKWVEHHHFPRRRRPR